MITVRRARPADAGAIGAVHVAAWRSAYPGILPDAYLAGLSAPRQAAYYDSAVRSGVGVHVAAASGTDLGALGGAARIVGFVTGSPARPGRWTEPLGDGEIETLYVLDDWRERGLGRRLMRAAAEATIQVAGAPVVQTAYVWSPIEKLVQASSLAP